MPRPRPARPPVAAPDRAWIAAGRVAGWRRALVLAAALAPGVARAGEPGGAADGSLSERTGESSPGEVGGRSEPPGAASPDLSERSGPGADEATRWTAEGQRRRAAGDLDAAIVAWQRATAALPVTQATAHRRAGLALAIATGHAEAARTEPGRLRQAIAVLDAYLAGLDPTDDENRVAVEQRRAELVARRIPARPTAVLTTTTMPPPRDRRVLLAGGIGLGLGAAGLALMGVGLFAGSRADRALTAAVLLPGDDPQREADKHAAWARGLRANQLAVAGGVIGGALVVAGLALTIAGVVRRPAPRRARLTPTFAAGGLRWRF